MIDLGEQLIYIVLAVRLDECGDKFEDNSSFICCQLGFCPASGSALLGDRILRNEYLHNKSHTQCGRG